MTIKACVNVMAASTKSGLQLAIGSGDGAG